MMPPDLSEPGKHAGPSILETCWFLMDSCMNTLMAARLDGKEPPLEERYRAQGIAGCLAIFTNPYKPNVDAIRAEAMERWEARNAE